MANEKKNVSADISEDKAKVEKMSKAAKDDKKSAKRADKGKNGSKKPKKSIVKYFKDAKSEFKKVVWPTPKSTTTNTIVVIAVCLVAAAFIFGIDSLFGLLNKLILG
ncbi:MAG: preprotein translocase subunit SecE [Oscillospiraceae bacterium]